ncbi:MAG: tetratricopeptide repeat protein [Odoribacter sp.]|nr:tetratricopeptide repeat protein [Odoribacter sp.]MDY3034504.1 tetratricopeptide repeat protein [Odoribacter sp.]
MKKFGLILSLVASVCTTTFGQTDLAAINRPIELLNDANHDIEEGNYETAVQKLIASIRLNPNQREAYMSLNTACSYTNQVSILKSYLIKAKEIFKEDDELCYYLGNIYQNENNLSKAIQEYSNAIKYSKQNGEDFELVYAYYQNRASCYLKQNLYTQAIADYNYALKLNQENGAIYANRGIALFKIGKRAEAIKDWRKAVELGVTSASVYLKRYAR